MRIQLPRKWSEVQVPALDDDDPRRVALAFIVCVASIVIAAWSALQQPREQPVDASES